MSGSLMKLIVYLKKMLIVFLLWMLTPREVILRQRDKIYSIKLSTNIQGFILSFITIIGVWIVYSSMFYVKFDELIIALEPSAEGDTTSSYLLEILKDVDIKVSRLARGVPVGSSFDYIDEVTLTHSLEDRIEYK